MYDFTGSGILGSGTAELQIGSNATTAGNPLVVPANARGLLEVVPWQAGNAVVTASESINTQFRMDSNDVATMIPKLFNLPEILGGLGTAVQHVIPALQAFKCNTPLNGGERINYYAKPQVANTTATIVGAHPCYSDMGTRGAEQFYQNSTNTTITAPAAFTRSAGSNVTITGGRLINFVQPHIMSVVTTAAQSYVGVAELTSSDFIQSYPYKFPTQPVGGFLGASSSPADLNGDKYYLDEPIPIRNTQCIVSPFWTNHVLQTGNVNFVTTLGFLK